MTKNNMVFPNFVQNWTAFLNKLVIDKTKPNEVENRISQNDFFSRKENASASFKLTLVEK